MKWPTFHVGQGNGPRMRRGKEKTKIREGRESQQERLRKKNNNNAVVVKTNHDQKK